MNIGIQIYWPIFSFFIRWTIFILGWQQFQYEISAVMYICTTPTLLDRMYVAFDKSFLWEDHFWMGCSKAHAFGSVIISLLNELLESLTSSKMSNSKAQQSTRARVCLVLEILPWTSAERTKLRGMHTLHQEAHSKM